MMQETRSEWLRSAEVRKALNIATCDLMHIRLEGKLRFQKKGNAFFYSKQDLERREKTH